MLKPYHYPKINCIKQVVAESCGITASDLIIKRTRRYSKERQLAMYLMREMTDLSFLDIGIVFCRHHSTVMHAHEAVKWLVNKNDINKNYVELLKRTILDREQLKKCKENGNGILGFNKPDYR